MKRDATDAFYRDDEIDLADAVRFAASRSRPRPVRVQPSRPERPRRGPMASGVYFVQLNDGGRIKIGAAARIDIRVARIESCCPAPLALLGVILDRKPFGREAVVHDMFAAHRRHYEWFDPAPELLEFIEKHAQRWP